MKKNTAHIGRRLLEAVTKEQLVKLLDIVFSQGDVERWQDDISKADPDLAATLARLLAVGAGRKPADPEGATEQTASITMSAGRLLERWRDLWKRWDETVAEVGDEDGRYAVQEHHWEEAYFDAASLSYDLEAIAGEMLPLLDEVYPLVNDPELFFAALEMISAAIGDYPEWMGVEYEEGCTLGKNTTRCVLRWSQLGAGDGPEAGAALLEVVQSLITSDERMELDEDACVSFFAELPDPCCREIYDRLAANVDKYDLQKTRSVWRRVADLYEERFDPAKYLETCRRFLAENWRYGPPLIAAAVEKGEHRQAEQYLVETFASLLRPEGGKTWLPEQSLPKDIRLHYAREHAEIMTKLLATWAEVARHLDNPIRSAAATVQRAIHRNPDDWETIVGEFRKITDPAAREALRPLFVQWQDMAARGNIPYYYRLPVNAVTEAWVHWLLAADLDRETKADWFRDKLGRWLEQMRLSSHPEAAAVFQAQWPWLARLTKDVADTKVLAADYPHFTKTVLGTDHNGPSVLDQGRQAALRRLAPPTVELSLLLEIWGDHLAAIVPDPSSARNSRYGEQADWMTALYEINRDAYNRLIARWRQEHKRKTSLWRELQDRKLPIPY